MTFNSTIRSLNISCFLSLVKSLVPNAFELEYSDIVSLTWVRESSSETLGLILARFSRFWIRLFLILKSNWEEHSRLGARLTSMSQGLRLLSIRMSNPNNSKQLFLKVRFYSWALQSFYSIERKVFTTTSSISTHIDLQSIPNSSILVLKVSNDHLKPSPLDPSSALKIEFFLFTLKFVKCVKTFRSSLLISYF